MMLNPTDRNKDKDAFRQQMEALYSEHSSYLLRVATRKAGSLEAGEDVVQKVYLRLLQREELPPDFYRNPRAYLYQATVNEALHLIEAWGRHGFTDANVELLAEPAPAPCRDKELGQIRAAMEKMNPDHVEVLNLYYIDELSWLEVARRRGKRVDTVCRELRRARAEVKKWIRILEEQDETQKEKREGNRGSVHAHPTEA
jgi:RNA polymerase sigma factor (sigma-70 family)